ncbi:unnamed protein product [Lathyrus sativus]|nr:unnamed protein product [Lathyrus sativus]
MYKNKLQELCQKKSWRLPVYDTTRAGPPHDPLFTTTVTVNSVPFTSSTPSRTLKLSQNDAAFLAFNHFSEQNPVSSPFLPNLAAFPQPSFSGSLNAAVSQDDGSWRKTRQYRLIFAHCGKPKNRQSVAMADI